MTNTAVTEGPQALDASVLYLPGRSVELIGQGRFGIVVDVDPTPVIPKYTVQWSNGDFNDMTADVLRAVNPDRPALAYDEFVVAALGEKLAERAGAESLAGFHNGWNNGRVAYTEAARDILRDIDRRAFALKHQRCHFTYVETPVRDGAAIAPLAGDVWVDTSLRSDVHDDGVHWHARLDGTGQVELYEPNGPGLIPAAAVAQIRGGFKLLTRPGAEVAEQPAPPFEPSITWKRKSRGERWRDGDRLVECLFFGDGPDAHGHCAVHHPVRAETAIHYATDEQRASGEAIARAPIAAPGKPAEQPRVLTDVEQQQVDVDGLVDVVRAVLIDEAQQQAANAEGGADWPGMGAQKLRAAVDAECARTGRGYSLDLYWRAIAHGIRQGRVRLHSGPRYSPAPDHMIGRQS
jgi:hypothetical protein